MKWEKGVFGYELKTVIVPIVLLHNFCCEWSKVGHDGIYELWGKGFLSNFWRVQLIIQGTNFLHTESYSQLGASQLWAPFSLHHAIISSEPAISKLVTKLSQPSLSFLKCLGSHAQLKWSHFWAPLYKPQPSCLSSLKRPATILSSTPDVSELHTTSIQPSLLLITISEPISGQLSLLFIYFVFAIGDYCVY